MRRKAKRMPTTSEVAEFIVAYTTRIGWPPSRRDLAGHFGISLERTQYILRQCAEEGLIETGTGARQIRVMKQIQGPETQL